MFGSEPTLDHEHYVLWVLDDPAINFVIEDGGERRGLMHLGIQAQDAEELEKQFVRVAQTGAKVIDQGETQCCYARSTKNWAIDPDGILFESFLTHEWTADFGTPFFGNTAELTAR